MIYEYTVGNVRDSFGRTVIVGTLYPLSIGMEVWVPLSHPKLMRVLEILMYNNEAVIVVEEI